MHRRLLRTTGFRLAALQTLLFLLTFIIAGAAGFGIVRRAEYRAAHAEIEELEDDFTDRLRQYGLANTLEHFNREHRDEAHDYRLEDGAGRWMAGGLPASPVPRTIAKTWVTYRAGPTTSPNREAGQVLAFVHPEPDGMRVTVGEFLSVRERQDDDVILAIVMAAGGVALAGMAIGAVVAARVQRRIGAMAGTVDRFGSGERDARIPQPGPPRSDLDDLAASLNQMMGRENHLVDSLRQATSAIAHDLRRPLARHNQIIAQALAEPADPDRLKAALADAAARVEEVLDTFKALLDIAELEGGAPGLVLQIVDLGEVAERLVEAFTPTAEAGGRTLVYQPPSTPARIRAEPRVLGRMIANLIENALDHTPPGVTVRVRVETEGPRLVVEDDGPGVPPGEHQRILQRFVRLDPSRSQEGAGLGLALAAAVAKAFGGRLQAEDAGPGLRIVAAFGVDQ